MQRDCVRVWLQQLRSSRYGSAKGQSRLLFQQFSCNWIWSCRSRHRAHPHLVNKCSFSHNKCSCNKLSHSVTAVLFLNDTRFVIHHYCDFVDNSESNKVSNKNQKIEVERPLSNVAPTMEMTLYWVTGSYKIRTIMSLTLIRIKSKCEKTTITTFKYSEKTGNTGVKNNDWLSTFSRCVRMCVYVWKSCLLYTSRCV